MTTALRTVVRRSRTAKPKLDAIGAAAIDQAREALLEVTDPGQVGDHVRVDAGADRMVTHVFECLMPGYRGWSWVVVMNRAPRAKYATVAETALLPGDGALLAPAWEPWAERLRPEDVGPDDQLPYKEYDSRLEQGYEATGEDEEDRVAQWELGLGRPRVLSPEGRSEAAERWEGGDYGPRPVSRRGRRGTVAATCASCGFLMKLDGSLRTEFGVCANEWSQADGRVVHLQYGCGSHSETGKDLLGSEVPKATQVVVDDLEVQFERIERAAEAEEANSAKESSAVEEAPVEEAPAEQTPAEESEATEQGEAAEQDERADKDDAA